MDKILTFIVNRNKELLLLKGSSKDPQFKKSFWYVVTGECEEIDKDREITVKREIKEETGLEVEHIKYLNWVFEYMSLGKKCIEYVYISNVKENEIILNEESVDYKWCNLDEFIDTIKWYYDKDELRKVLEYALNNKRYFENEKREKDNILRT